MVSVCRVLNTPANALNLLWIISKSTKTNPKMTIAERFHAIITEIENLLHLHPSNTTAIAAKQAEVAALTSHPDVPPETAAVIASASASAAAAIPPAPPVDNAHVAEGCEQFTEPAGTPATPPPGGWPPAAPPATEPAPTPAP